jgi:hypothetical protein
MTETPTLKFTASDEKSIQSNDDGRYSRANQRQSLTIDTVIANPGFSSIYPWKCPPHDGDSKCCHDYIASECPGWDGNYFAFIFMTAESIVCSKDWKFKFVLVFDYHSKYYAYPIRTSYNALKELENQIKLEEKTTKLFPRKKFPDPFSKESVDWPLQQNMEIDASILCRKTLPWFLTMAAGIKQVEKICKYVQHLFSSPSLLQKPWFYENVVTSETKFFLPLKDHLQKKAQEQLKAWNACVQPKSMCFEELKEQVGNALCIFHTAYVLRKPSEQTRVSCHHWALALEGNHWLFRVEFCEDNCIKWILLENETQTRRAFWFGSNPNFTERWFMLSSFEATRKKKPLHVAQIGLWLECWLQRHPKYSDSQNNCQHFVRDIVAHFSTSKALDLNGLMDLQSSTTLVPGMVMSNNLSQYNRTFEEWEKSQELKLHLSKSRHLNQSAKKSMTQSTDKETCGSEEDVVKEKLALREDLSDEKIEDT